VQILKWKFVLRKIRDLKSCAGERKLWLRFDLWGPDNFSLYLMCIFLGRCSFVVPIIRQRTWSSCIYIAMIKIINSHIPFPVPPGEGDRSDLNFVDFLNLCWWTLPRISVTTLMKKRFCSWSVDRCVKKFRDKCNIQLQGQFHCFSVTYILYVLTMDLL
jgi:hypothetical protein